MVGLGLRLGGKGGGSYVTQEETKNDTVNNSTKRARAIRAEKLRVGIRKESWCTGCER